MMSIIGSFETNIRGSLGEIPLFEVRIYSLAYTQGSHLDMEIAGEGIIIQKYEQIQPHMSGISFGSWDTRPIISHC